jgi:aspartate/methionine/tyrosine aminotransferase
MKVNHPQVKYSSIVSIGDEIIKLEAETNDKYLKLHRGVMDVTTINIETTCDFNNKSLQQYSGNDGYQPLINTIKENFNLNQHRVVITPGGMAGLDLIFNSISERQVWIGNYHWGSWNKILKLHNKNIKMFDEFKFDTFRPKSGIVLLCFPSNPTGYSPKLTDIKNFLIYSKEHNITVVLDLPYYYLFNDDKDTISNYFYDNVIVI